MTILLILSIFLLVVYISLLLYYRAAWNEIPVFHGPDLKYSPSTLISVIIPARNESANLPALLQSISAQTYPEALFEVLIIDDHSTDDTASIVVNFTTKNIRLISLQQSIGNIELNSYKKKAIETGIIQSSGTLIVTTDADCILPAGWLMNFAIFYEQFRPAFIVAPVAIKNALNFIQVFQAVDFMTLQGITGAAVYKKILSMCNGANMAYEKSVFTAVGGFAGIDQIASGDDMLLMHKVSNHYPGRVLYLKSKNSIVETAPVKTIKEFFDQRIRWASKADKYDDKRILPVLILVYALNLLMLIFPIVCLFDNPTISIFNEYISMGWIWLILLVIKTMGELAFLIPVAVFFNKQKLLIIFPFLQPFHIIYTVIAGWLGKFGSFQWKDRKVK